MLRLSLVATSVALVLGSESAQWQNEFMSSDLDLFSLSDYEQLFDVWAFDLQKTYVSELERTSRFGIWLEALIEIAKHNDQDLDWKNGLNQFTDWTPEEFKTYVGRSGVAEKRSLSEDNLPKGVTMMTGDDVSDIQASSVDWVSKGAVAAIKDQGSCGSCWAFSAVAAMECRYTIANSDYNNVRTLSEQQIVSCDTTSYGCNGGWYQHGYEYSEKEGGICTESEYPYTARTGKCSVPSNAKLYDKPKGYKQVTAYSASSLKSAVDQGCVSIDVEADQSSWQYYKSGVLSSSTCGESTDHCVLVVGYGTDSGSEYWKVRNSWGTSWGEKGYIRLCRECNKNCKNSKCGGQCGILTDPGYPQY